jgi:hypothetical protein
MDQHFPDDEKLYRAVFPAFLLVKENGKVSSAAFKDKRGMSVLRGDGRDDTAVDEELHRKLGFDKKTAVFTAFHCRQVEAVPIYKPSSMSKYHSEVHGSCTEKVLNSVQRKHLADVSYLL